MLMIAKKNLKTIFRKKNRAIRRFLTKQQVWQLISIADELDIPVLTYGLRSDRPLQNEIFSLADPPHINP